MENKTLEFQSLLEPPVSRFFSHKREFLVLLESLLMMAANGESEGGCMELFFKPLVRTDAWSL
jgi:hypothetical protein